MRNLFRADCSGDLRRERENTRPPENKKQGKEDQKQEEQIRHPQREKGEKSNTEKRRSRKTAQLQKKKKKAWKEKKNKKTEDGVSPPYVETFEVKVNKKSFVPE